MKKRPVKEERYFGPKKTESFDGKKLKCADGKGKYQSVTDDALGRNCDSRSGARARASNAQLALSLARLANQTSQSE